MTHKIIRSLWSWTSLRRIIIITILVVKLSKIAERKKVMKAIFHNKLRFDLERITFLTQLKPPFWSTISTIVIAPMRKEKRGCSVTKMFCYQLVGKCDELISNTLKLWVHQLHKWWRVDHIENPTENKHQQSNCSFVDFRQTFHRYECITQDENDDNSKC